MRILRIIFFVSIHSMLQSSNSCTTTTVVAFTILPKPSHRTASTKSIRSKQRGTKMLMMSSRLPNSTLSSSKKNKQKSSSHHNDSHPKRNSPKLQSSEFIIFPNDARKKNSTSKRSTSLQSTKVSTNESYFPSSSSSSSSSGKTYQLASFSLTDIVTKLIAFFIPLSVLLTLAMNNNDPTEFTSSMLSSSSTSSSTSAAAAVATKEIDYVIMELEENIEKLELLGTNILDAALPQDATDLFSIALGESLAGLLGALATWGLNMSLMLGGKKMMESRSNNPSTIGTRTSTSSSTVNTYLVQGESKEGSDDRKKVNDETSAAKEMDNIITEAVADGDYFLTRAAATPLIGSVGMSSGMASALTVLLASVPYELIKLNARAKEQRRLKEDMYMDALLQEENTRKKKWFGLSQFTMSSSSSSSDKKSPSKDVLQVMKEDQKMINEEEEPMEMKYQFDSIELFADVCKWLEYDVLMTDFGGKLTWYSTGIPINSGLESAAFGALAALSSQIYADIIYTFSDSMGLRAKRDEVRSRKIEEFFQLYSIKCVSAATLFGVYESARLPITQIVINFLSGGYDSCLGSKDFDLCLETYFFSNPAEATPEAQFRSFVVASMNLLDRIAGDISNENVDAAGLIRSLAVQLYSIIGFDLPSMVQ